MGYEWDGKYFCYLASGDFKNCQTGVIMSPRKTCQYLNFAYEENNWMNRKDIQLYEENEWRKEYQRVLENKIRRLKKRIQVLEK